MQLDILYSGDTQTLPIVYALLCVGDRRVLYKFIESRLEKIIFIAWVKNLQEEFRGPTQLNVLTLK